MTLPDQRAVEREHLADHASGLIAVVDDERADAGVDGQHLEPQIRDEPDALRPVLPQCPLAPDHPVTADQSHGYRRGEDDVVGEMLEQCVNVVRVPVPDPLLRERLRLGVIHAAMIPSRCSVLGAVPYRCGSVRDYQKPFLLERIR